jgi:hypothetical protein
MSAATSELLSPALRARQGVELRHLCDMSIGLEAATIPTPTGTRMTFTVTDGIVEGERLRGAIRPGGGDWVVLGEDGIARLDVRATLETDDGELVHLTNTGRAVLSEEASALLAAGERADAGRIYARSAPLFETGSERYAWLNGIVTVAVNEIALDRVGYRVFEVL